MSARERRPRALGSPRDYTFVAVALFVVAARTMPCTLPLMPCTLPPTTHPPPFRSTQNTLSNMPKNKTSNTICSYFSSKPASQQVTKIRERFRAKNIFYSFFPTRFGAALVCMKNSRPLASPRSPQEVKELTAATAKDLVVDSGSKADQVEKMSVEESDNKLPVEESTTSSSGTTKTDALDITSDSNKPDTNADATTDTTAVASTPDDAAVAASAGGETAANRAPAAATTDVRSAFRERVCGSAFTHKSLRLRIVGPQPTFP